MSFLERLLGSLTYQKHRPIWEWQNLSPSSLFHVLAIVVPHWHSHCSSHARMVPTWAATQPANLNQQKCQCSMISCYKELLPPSNSMQNKELPSSGSQQGLCLALQPEECLPHTLEGDSSSSDLAFRAEHLLTSVDNTRMVFPFSRLSSRLHCIFAIASR